MDTGEAIIPLAEWVNQLIDWLIITHGDRFESINGAMLRVLGRLEGFMRDVVPWWLMVLALAALAWNAARRWLPALGVAVALMFVWALGLWSAMMQTLSLMLVAIVITIVIALPLGILMARSNGFRAAALPVLDLMQTMPPFVYLIPAVMLFGLGAFSAVIATTIYSAPPLMRLTDLGIRLVDTEVVEAADAFGADRFQKLWGVLLPLALPNIMAGVNQVIMLALSMVVIASMIGVRGLGQEVLQGLMRQEPGTGFAAGFAIVLLAIVLDRITQAYGRRLGLRRSRAR